MSIFLFILDCKKKKKKDFDLIMVQEDWHKSQTLF